MSQICKAVVSFNSIDPQILVVYPVRVYLIGGYPHRVWQFISFDYPKSIVRFFLLAKILLEFFFVELQNKICTIFIKKLPFDMWLLNYIFRSVFVIHAKKTLSSISDKTSTSDHHCSNDLIRRHRQSSSDLIHCLNEVVIILVQILRLLVVLVNFT